jgi:hypothetical protein
MTVLSTILDFVSPANWRQGRRQAKQALALVFIVVLLIGWLTTTVNMMVSWRDLPQGRKFVHRFETCFNDHLAGRDVLSAVHAHLRVDFLGASSTPRVWLGDQGWLFYNAEAESTYLKPADPALDRRLDAWVHAIPAWRAWLADCGIRFLVVVAPDKQSVCPEYLPRVRRPIPGKRPLDHVLAAWHADLELTVLDLRGPLIEASQHAQVYFRSDTHWNPAGCFTAYSQTVAALRSWFPWVEPQPPAAFDWTPCYLNTADLVRLLGLRHHAGEPYTTPRPRGRQRPDPSGPRVMLFHDSFADDLFVSLLGPHCSRLTAVASRHLDADMIERDRPDVVVLELAERYLQAETPLSPTSPPFGRMGTVRPPQ